MMGFFTSDERMMGFGYRLYPSYNGYNGVGGEGIGKMIDQLLAKHAELPALPTERGCYFFTVALAERRSRLLTENIQARVGWQARVGGVEAIAETHRNPLSVRVEVPAGATEAEMSDAVAAAIMRALQK